MSASTIFLNGRVIATPGSYSTVDASGLEQVGIGATGIVAIVGTVVGGRPVSTSLQAADFIRLNSPEKVRRTFRSGDLREAGAMAFEPSADGDILGGAQEVVFMKTNQATQSIAQLENAGGPVIDLTSVDYGAFTTQVNVAIGTAVQGKSVTITFEDTTEAGTNIGGVDLVTLTYIPAPLNSWGQGGGTVEVSIDQAGRVTVAATRIAIGLGLAGAITGQVMYVANSPITLTATVACTVDVTGKNAAGLSVLETVVLPAATPTPTLGNFSEFTGLTVTAVTGTTDITIAANAIRTDPLVQTTIQKAADFVNARSAIIGVTLRGFVWTNLTGRVTAPVTEFDEKAATNVLNPVVAGLRGDLAAVVNFINATSQLVSAAVTATPVSKTVPNDIPSPVFLSGGTEGAATFNDYQVALNLLKRVRVNSIVVMTPDPAVHAALDAHCAFMAGIGRSERDAFVGLLNTLQTGLPTKTEIKAQIVDLNTRHIRAFGQSVTRFNTAGERTVFDPPFAAVIAAGMQAGAQVGTSLTHKFANVLDVNQHVSWNPVDDSEEMIQAGLCFMERLDGVGRRWVRNVTTWLKSNNLAFVEGSVNQAVNFAVFEFRTFMETFVGKRGFSGTVNAAKGGAINKLGILISSGAITVFRALQLELIVDVLEVSVELAPIIPINFVKTTIHLVTLRQAA